MESELKLALPSCQLLLSVAMAADPACVLVVREVVPLLVQRLSQCQPTLRRVLFEMLANFADVAQQFANREGVGHAHSVATPSYHVAPPIPIAVANPLERHRDLLLHTLLSALGGDQVELKVPALRIARCLFSVLSDSEVSSVAVWLYLLMSFVVTSPPSLPSPPPHPNLADVVCSICIRASCEW